LLVGGDVKQPRCSLPLRQYIRSWREIAVSGDVKIDALIAPTVAFPLQRDFRPGAAASGGRRCRAAMEIPGAMLKWQQIAMHLTVTVQFRLQ